MARGGQLFIIIVTALLLAVSILHIPVSVIRGSRDGGVTWPSHLVLHEAQDSLASPVSPRDTHSKHQALSDGDASRGEDSSGGRLHHFSQAHRDLETEFDRRRRVLQKGCKLHDAKVALPDIMWRSHPRISPHGQLTFCVTPKVASSSLLRLYQELRGLKPTTHQSMEVMLVRHPLARLASAYRDKFLNGNPLHKYNNEWRSNTDSSEPWDIRFVQYWLPALISTGSVEQTPVFKKMFRNIKELYQRFIKNYMSQTGAILVRPSEEEEDVYGVKLVDIIYNMLQVGPYFGMYETCNNTYNLTDTMERFKNASFTFSQFLRHVVWTHEQGMPDRHWMTYIENCNPCRRRLDYILKLETVQEEMNHLFHHVLGFPQSISFPVRHRSIGHSLGLSDRQYYASVSPELMYRILHIYRHDFALFGYKHDV